jgi:hypothetical protein
MKSGLLGPYDLSFDGVELALPQAQCGVFALGHVDAAGTFRVQRVGRDDQDLRRILRGLIGSSNCFKFAPAASPREAFGRECELFHRLRPPGNIIHPDRPKGSDWRCPVCLQYHF